MTEIPRPTRLRGTLLDRRKPEAPTSVGAECLRNLGVEVQLGDDSRVESIGPAEVVRSVRLGGLVHISRSPIEKFTADKVGPNGKFGAGTYFAAGALEGETFSGLSTPGVTLHAAELSGTVAFVDRANIREFDEFLKDQAGLPKSGLRTSVANAPVATTLEQAGSEVDALVVFMDPERTAAEVVVLPHALEHTQITESRTL